MTRWFYNSDGDPIAFLWKESVFTARGDFVGILYPDNQIWNGDYVGEVFQEERLIYNTRTLFGTRPLPRMPGLPAMAGEPVFRGPITVPLGFRDVDIG